MQTYIALLRGINVSGTKKIKMEDLKTHLNELGFCNLQTYIQSGNIIFESNKTDQEILMQSIKDKIREKYGFDVPVLVKNIDEWKQVFEKNPFTKVNGVDIKNLYVTFLAENPKDERIGKLIEYDNLFDEFKLLGNVVYINCYSGYGKTKLNNNFFETKLKVSATTRNWKTVCKLMEMTLSSL